MTGDERLAKVAEVLAGHANWSDARDPWPDTRWVCTCGEPVDENPSGVNVIARHRAHVAASLAPLLDEFRAEDEARALREVKAVLDDSCHHCGSGPDDDGDHSCPCPNTDSECLEHLEYPVLPTNLRAALAAAEPDVGAR